MKFLIIILMFNQSFFYDANSTWERIDPKEFKLSFTKLAGLYLVSNGYISYEDDFGRFVDRNIVKEDKVHVPVGQDGFLVFSRSCVGNLQLKEDGFSYIECNSVNFEDNPPFSFLYVEVEGCIEFVDDTLQMNLVKKQYDFMSGITAWYTYDFFAVYDGGLTDRIKGRY